MVTLTGRDVYLGPRGNPQSYQRYARAIAEWSATGRPPRPAFVAAVNVGELVDAFRTHAENNYVKAGKPTSEQANYRTVSRILLDLYPETSEASFPVDDNNHKNPFRPSR